MKQQITIKDIAHMCNTSVSTVSRVLNGHPDVSEGLRRRVLETVAQNSYVPNNSARNLAKTRSDAIALILRGAENPFFNRLIKTATPAIYRRNYSCVLHQIPSDGDEIRAAAALARERRLQGILFFGGRFNYTPEEVALLQVPFVCCTYTNAFGCLDAAAYSSVTIDDTRAASRAVRELCTRGHRRIAALIVEKDDHSIGELRFRGYKAALQEQGIPYDPDLVECVHDFNMESAYQGTQRLIDRAGDFTALFARPDGHGGHQGPVPAGEAGAGGLFGDRHRRVGGFPIYHPHPDHHGTAGGKPGGRKRTDLAGYDRRQGRKSARDHVHPVTGRGFHPIHRKKPRIIKESSRYGTQQRNFDAYLLLAQSVRDRVHWPMRL